MTMHQCTASNSSRYANSCTENGITTADCWDCPGRFELVEDRNPQSTRLVLPLHHEDGTIVERALKTALKVTVSPETEAHHLAQIREELAQ
jgi:hypothetical protein